jgi:hypothetical protein
LDAGKLILDLILVVGSAAYVVIVAYLILFYHEIGPPPS